MDWQMLFVYSVAVCSMFCLAGILLLEMRHTLWKRERDRIEWDERQLIRKLHNMLFEVTVECMDILPEKILEAKKTIEGE